MPKFKKSEVVTRNDGASITVTHGETYPTTFGPITVNLHPKVIVQVGPTRARKKVLRSDLCRASPQWAMVLRNMFPQCFAGIVSIPRVDVETFRHFRRWLEDRSYHPDTWDVALKLLAFADASTVYDLRNDLIGAFFRFYVDPAHINFVPPHAFVDALYAMPNHPLSGVGKPKDLVSELYVRRRSRQELRDNEYSSRTLDTGFKTQLLWKSPNTTGWYTEHWGPRRDPAWLRCPMVLEDYLVNDELTAAWSEKDPETGREKCHVHDKEGREIRIHVYLANGLPACYDMEGREIPFYARPSGPRAGRPAWGVMPRAQTPGRLGSAEAGLSNMAQR